MFLKTVDGPVYYEASGPCDAPAVLLTHGVGLNTEMFTCQSEALSDRYRVMTWDMPGHGRSARLKGPLVVNRMAEHIIGILDALEQRSALLAGHSLGSWVCQDAAVRFPDRVTAVVSISGEPFDRAVSRPEIFGYRVWLALARLFPGRLLASWTARVKATTPAARRFAENSMNAMGREQFLFAVAGMLDAGSSPLDRPPRQPLLIIHGEHEMPKSVSRVCRQWHESVPGSRYAVLPGAGHNGNQDSPDEFNRILAGFLTEVAGAASRRS